MKPIEKCAILILALSLASSITTFVVLHQLQKHEALISAIKNQLQLPLYIGLLSASCALGVSVWVVFYFSKRFRVSECSKQELEGLIAERTAELSRSERRFRAAFDCCPEALFLSSNGTFIDCNKKALSLLMLEKEQVIGRTASEVWPELVGHEAGISLNQAYTTGKAVHLSNVGAFLRREGEEGETFFNLDYVPLRNEKQEVIEVLSISRETTEQVMANRRVEESEQRLLLAQRAGRIVVFDWDLKTGSVTPTLNVQEVFGVPTDQEELLLEQWARYVPPEELSRLNELFDDWFKSGEEEREWEYRLCYRQKECWVYNRGRLILDQNKVPVRVIGSCMDITERKRSEEALKESQVRLLEEQSIVNTLLDTIPDIVFIKDKQSAYLLGNKTFAGYLGVSKEEMVGRNDFDFQINQELAVFFQQQDREVMDVGEVRQYDQWITNSEGQRLLLEILKAPFRNANGEVVGVIGVGRDITKRYRFQQELISARMIADAANQAKSEFLANVSHEIRTPLNAILGMTSLLLETKLDAEQREYGSVVYSSGDLLLSIINDILDSSKIQAGRFSLCPVRFSLRDLVNRTTALLRARFEEKKLNFTSRVEEGVVDNLIGDDLRLGQILANLLGNAIKFTPEGGGVMLDVRGDIASTKRHSDRVCLHFVVSDTGIGIPSEKVKGIFSPFVQGDGSTTRAFGGTGLGLSISKDLVEQMGGQIWTESELGKGSSFHFTVVLKIAKELSEINKQIAGLCQSEITVAETPLALTVLLVEDNLANQRVAFKFLEKRGHQVLVANNGREALALFREKMKEGGLDLVLMDCQMPEMDGFECVCELRKCEQGIGRHVPVIAMTAHAMVGDREKCIEAGMEDYLSKPIKLSDLDRILEKWGTKEPTSAVTSKC